MTDMIEGLSRTAMEVGTDAATHLSEPHLVAALGEQVRSGRKRRRVRATAGVGLLAVVVGTAAIVVPRLTMDPELLEPADTPPAVISSVGNLTVFDDGSMSLFTQRGTFVDIDAPGEGDTTSFEQLPKDIVCAFDGGAVDAGWVFYEEEARQVIQFARPQLVDIRGDRTAAVQGSTIDPVSSAFAPHLALTMDAEVATAPQLGIRQTLVSVELAGEPGVPGKVIAYGSKLDAAPTVVITGDTDSLNRLATVTADPVSRPEMCDTSALAEDKLAAGTDRIRHYLVADVFLLDRAGNARLLATHTSWVNTVVEP